MKKSNLIVAVDFDGTCVSHSYPNVGTDIGAIPVLRYMVDHGCRIILWTIRSGEYLKDAEHWFHNAGIPLYGVNNNPDQHTWSLSRKAYAHMYIDDAAVGCPLIRSGLGSTRPYVDWLAIHNIMRGIFEPASMTIESKNIYDEDYNE